MARELEGKVAVVTGAASGIGLASTEAMLAAGARVVMADRDEAALEALRARHGEAVIPLAVDLLDPKDCASLLPRVLEMAGQLDILHANAGLYVGGDLVDADTGAIDRMLNLNVNVVMKNVHDVLPHMIERRKGDIIVTSSLAAHFPTPWEPVYASSKWAINCFVQTVRRQVFQARHPRRLDLARPRRHRLACGLAAGEAQGSQGVRKPAGARRSGQRGHVHADPATRHDHSRRCHAADEFRPLGACLLNPGELGFEPLKPVGEPDAANSRIRFDVRVEALRPSFVAPFPRWRSSAGCECGKGRGPPLGELQDIVGEADEAPLVGDLLDAAQEKLTEAARLLDLSEHRLGQLLS